MKKRLFGMSIMILVGILFCNGQLVSAKKKETVSFDRCIRQGKAYDVNKLLKDVKKDTLSLAPIPAKSSMKWQTADKELNIKGTKIVAKKKGIYRVAARVKNVKYMIRLTVVSGELEEVDPDEVQYVQIKEGLTAVRETWDASHIRDICQKLNGIRWKFNYKKSNKKGYGHQYQVRFYMKSGKVKNYVTRGKMFESGAYYMSSPSENISEYIDEIYKNLPDQVGNT